MSGKKLEGIILPLSTPLNKDQSFDKAGMSELLEYVIPNKVDGVFTLGTCGEGPYFDINECKEIMKYVVDQVDGRVSVYVGVGRNSTKETCKLAKYASDIGADFIVVMPPYFFKNIETEQLLDHYKTISKAADRVVLYNLPEVAANLTVSHIQELSEIENIVGLKDASGNLEYFKQVADILPTVQGNDNLLYESMIRGGTGGVAGLANIIPKKFVDLFRYFRENKEEALKLQKDINRFVEIIYDKPRSAQAGVKQGLKFLGICDNTMRTPLPKVNAEEEELINNFLASNL